jgi:hypothetical protein
MVPVLADYATPSGGVLELPPHKGEIQAALLQDWVQSDAGKCELREWVARLQLTRVD